MRKSNKLLQARHGTTLRCGAIFQKPLERVLGGLLIIADNLPSGGLLVELTDKLLQWQRCIETQWEAVHRGGSGPHQK